MGVAVYSATSNGGWNDTSVDHTATAGDNFAIVVTCQLHAGSDYTGECPTPGAPTYGGEAMTYVTGAGEWSVAPGDVNSSHRGLWVYVRHGIKSGLQTVTFTPTAGYSGMLGVITGRWINPSPEDTDGASNISGGGWEYTISTTVGAMTICAGVKADAQAGPPGEGRNAGPSHTTRPTTLWTLPSGASISSPRAHLRHGTGRSPVRSLGLSAHPSRTVCLQEIRSSGYKEAEWQM